MADDEIVRHSRRFIKGVKRAFFTPVEPEDIEVAPTSSPPPSTSPKPEPQVAPPPQSVKSVVEATFKEKTTLPPATPPLPRKKRNIKPVIFIVLILILGGLAFYSVRMYLQSREELTRLQQTSPQNGEQEAKDIIARVGRHMMLPNEIPTVTGVTDVATLRDQPFFAKALNGDQILVYSKRAILYRPSIDKIIEVGYVLPTPAAGSEATNSSNMAASASGKILNNNNK